MGRAAPWLFLPLALFPGPSYPQTHCDDPAAQADAIAMAERMLPEVSRLSGLPVQGPVGVEVRDKAFFRAYYQGRLERQYPAPRRTAVEAAYRFLGLLSPGQDLVHSYLDSFLPDVEGFYDPDRKTLVLAGDLAPGDLEGVLAHELTHALQDQAVPFHSYFGGEGESLDSQFAKSALLEGQAVVVGLAYVQERARRGWVGPSGSAVPGPAPPVTGAGGDDFAYRYGPAFFLEGLRREGTGRITALLKDPPRSTEQVLHPDDYRPGGPMPESIPRLPCPAGSTEVWEDSLGEYGLSIVLQRWVPGARAHDAVVGWRGDRLGFYRGPSGGGWLAGRVVMTDGPAARRFAAAYARLLSRKYGPALEGPGGVRALPGAREACVRVRGREVIFLEGSARGRAAAMIRFFEGAVAPLTSPGAAPTLKGVPNGSGKRPGKNNGG